MTVYLFISAFVGAQTTIAIMRVRRFGGRNRLSNCTFCPGGSLSRASSLVCSTFELNYSTKLLNRPVHAFSSQFCKTRHFRNVICSSLRSRVLY